MDDKRKAKRRKSLIFTSRLLSRSETLREKRSSKAEFETSRSAPSTPDVSLLSSQNNNNNNNNIEIENTNNNVILIEEKKEINKEALFQSPKSDDNGPKKRPKRSISEMGIGAKISHEEPKAERQQRLQKMKASITELIETEDIYVRDLNTMIDKIMKPMSEKRNYLTGEPLVTREQLVAIWSNITLLPSFNEVLLKELTQAAEHEDFQAKIGKVWISMADYLKIYTQFCSNQPLSNKTVLELRNNSQFDAFLMEKADVTILEESHNLDLNAFLIKPIQRICKYPLFLKEILNSSHESDVGYILVEQAYEKINSVILSINESKKIAENNQKLRDITQIIYGNPVPIMVPTRKPVRHESLKKIVAGKSQFKGMVFLFNDCVFIGKNSKRKQSKVKYYSHFPLTNCTVSVKEDEGNCSFSLVGKIRLVCFTETEQQRDTWISDISNAITTCPTPGANRLRSNLFLYFKIYVITNNNEKLLAHFNCIFSCIIK